MWFCCNAFPHRNESSSALSSSFKIGYHCITIAIPQSGLLKAISTLYSNEIAINSQFSVVCLYSSRLTAQSKVQLGTCQIMSLVWIRMDNLYIYQDVRQPADLLMCISFPLLVKPVIE